MAGGKKPDRKMRYNNGNFSVAIEDNRFIVTQRGTINTFYSPTIYEVFDSESGDIIIRDETINLIGDISNLKLKVRLKLKYRKFKDLLRKIEKQKTLPFGVGYLGMFYEAYRSFIRMVWLNKEMMFSRGFKFFVRIMKNVKFNVEMMLNVIRDKKSKI